MQFIDVKILNSSCNGDTYHNINSVVYSKVSFHMLGDDWQKTTSVLHFIVTSEVTLPYVVAITTSIDTLRSKVLYATNYIAITRQ